MKMHWGVTDKAIKRWRTSICGKLIGDQYLTADPSKVDCMLCLRNIDLRETLSVWPDVELRSVSFDLGLKPENLERPLIIKTRPLSPEQILVMMDVLAERFPEFLYYPSKPAKEGTLWPLVPKA